MTIAAVLLAAGRSSRFGLADKLEAPLNGLALGLHAANALNAVRLDVRLVVTPPRAMIFPGFEIILNGKSENGMAHSIGLGVQAARQHGADAIMIALADMPFVPAAHFENMLASYDRDATILASCDGTQRMPPALFGSKWFAALEQLSGDRGARSLLNQADVIMADAHALVDIDRPEDLAKWQGD